MEKQVLVASNSKKIELYDIWRVRNTKSLQHITEGIRIKSKCEWYEHGGQSTKFFLNLEKQQGAQNTIKKLFVNDKKITGETNIQVHLKKKKIVQKIAQ